MLVVAVPAMAAAQTTPQSQAPFVPTIKVGTTIFADYTVTDTPKVTDANGEPVTLSAFNLTRAYVNVTGTVTPRISFRVTPDIVRDADAGSNLNGSLVFRLKYAYAQMRVGQDTTVKLGIQQTPLIDAQESIYRYRFQGTSFAEREGGLRSSDAGVTVKTPLPNGYGDVHVGVYNGESYTGSEVNNQKALVMRASFRPMPSDPIWKGLLIIGYVHSDSYAKGLARNRAAASAMFEHARFNAGFDFMRRVDQSTPSAREITGKGISFFVTPFLDRKGQGLEGLLRFDSFDPDSDVVGKRSRLITGVAYWFPRPGPATAALLAQMEQVRVSSALPSRTTERRFSVNVLIGF
jgi:hypothetical protein